MQAQARAAPSISRRTYGPAASSKGSPARETSKDKKGGSSNSGGTKRRTFGPSSASTSVDGEPDGVGADGAAAADAFSEGGISIADASSVAIPRRPTSGTYMAVRRPSEDTSAGEHGSPGLGGDATVMVTSPLAATRTRRASSGAMAYIAARRPTLSGSSTLGVSDGDGELVTGGGAGAGAGVSLRRPSIASSSGLGTTTTTRKSSGSEDLLGDVVMRTSPLALARPRLSSSTGGLGLSVVAGGGSSSGRRLSHAASEEGLELILPGSPSASASSPLRRPSMSMGAPGAGAGVAAVAGEGRDSPASVVVE